MKAFEAHFLLLVFAASICLFGYALPGFRSKEDPSMRGTLYLYWIVLGLFLAVAAILNFIGIVP